MSIVLFGGLDVHQKSIAAHVFCPETGELFEDEFPNERARLIHEVTRWQRAGEVRLCYEASSAGFVVKRWLDEVGVSCEVIAPAFVPKGPGDRIKTDRRDARRLAQYYASGMLRVVRVPTRDEETVRAVVRHRDDLTRDMTRCKNRTLKFLGLQGHRYTDGSNWTQGLNQLELEPDQALVLRSHLGCLDHLEIQREDVDRRIHELAQTPAYAKRVQRLMSLRGVGVYTAMVLLTEIGDAHRFGKAKELMSYLGLVPRQSNSGTTRHSGGITKVGNTRARWILAETAWRQTTPPGKSRRLREQWASQPAEVVAIGKKAEKRLHHKFWKIAVRVDRKTAATAVARELAGFVWAMLTLEVS
jgi:transposase